MLDMESPFWTIHSLISGSGLYEINPEVFAAKVWLVMFTGEEEPKKLFPSIKASSGKTTEASC